MPIPSLLQLPVMSSSGHDMLMAQKTVTNTWKVACLTPLQPGHNIRPNSQYAPPPISCAPQGCYRVQRYSKGLCLCFSNHHGLNLAYFHSLQESGLLQAASPFYKTFAIECLRAQVSVDMFLLSSVYQDVTSLGESWCYIMH